MNRSDDKTNEKVWQEAEKDSDGLGKALDQYISKVFKEGSSPQDALGLDKSILDSVYAQAYRLYNTGKYEEAIQQFRILIMMNSMETKYILALAACFHMIKDYPNAIQTYTMYSVLDPENPLPHYHTSDCFIQLKDYLSAMISLELAISRAEGKEQYSKIKERALLGLESLKSRLVSSADQLNK